MPIGVPARRRPSRHRTGFSLTTRIRPRRWPLLVAVAVIGCLGQSPSPASAHEPAATLVIVSHDKASLVLDVRAPLEAYDIAYGTELAADPTNAVAAAKNELISQLEEAVSISFADGPSWTTSITNVGTAEVKGAPNLSVRLVSTPPAGVVPGSVELNWLFIIGYFDTHKVFAVLDENVSTVLQAKTINSATILGVITAQESVLTIEDRAAPSATFATLFRIGFEHFREGPDHLLFLCLVALGAARRRHGWTSTASRLALLTMAFTVGHSISLAATTLGLISFPVALIETGIALTILVTAVHAIRPTLPARAELVVTGAFGLIHGCGFAGTLADLSIRGTDAVVPLLGFNLGLEAAQVLGLLLVAVPLVILSRSTLATAILAGAIGLIAIGWIGERAFDLSDPSAPIVEFLAGTPERLALVLAVAAAIVLPVRHRDRDVDANSAPARRALPRAE